MHFGSVRIIICAFFGTRYLFVKALVPKISKYSIPENNFTHCPSKYCFHVPVLCCSKRAIQFKYPLQDGGFPSVKKNVHFNEIMFCCLSTTSSVVITEIIAA